MLIDREVADRLTEDDFGEVMSAMDERLQTLPPEERAGWHQGDEGLLYLQSLSTGMLPLAGLDPATSMGYAKTFIDNFPIYGLPLGDVDERAANWLAQLLDTGTVRSDYRSLFDALAEAWQGTHPEAASRVRAWVADPMAPDPRQDTAWVRAMVAIARTQL